MSLKVTDYVDEETILEEVMEVAKYQTPPAKLQINYYFHSAEGYIMATKNKPIWIKQIQRWEEQDGDFIVILDYVGDKLTDKTLYYCNITYHILA